MPCHGLPSCAMAWVCSNNTKDLTIWGCDNVTSFKFTHSLNPTYLTYRGKKWAYLSSSRAQRTHYCKPNILYSSTCCKFISTLHIDVQVHSPTSSTLHIRLTCTLLQAWPFTPMLKHMLLQTWHFTSSTFDTIVQVHVNTSSTFYINGQMHVFASFTFYINVQMHVVDGSTLYANIVQQEPNSLKSHHVIDKYSNY